LSTSSLGRIFPGSGAAGLRADFREESIPVAPPVWRGASITEAALMTIYLFYQPMRINKTRRWWTSVFSPPVSQYATGYPVLGRSRQRTEPPHRRHAESWRNFRERL